MTSGRRRRAGCGARWTRRLWLATGVSSMSTSSMTKVRSPLPPGRTRHGDTSASEIFWLRLRRRGLALADALTVDHPRRLQAWSFLVDSYLNSSEELDSAGNVYVIGDGGANSDFGPFTPTSGDVFVTKLD